MDRLETADILAVLKAAYPQFYNGLSPKEANKIVDLWAEMFKDEPVMVVAVAVKAMIASRTNTFPPNIGEVKEQITKMRMPKEMTAAEAWTLVYSRFLWAHSYGAGKRRKGGRRYGQGNLHRAFPRNAERSSGQ